MHETPEKPFKSVKVRESDYQMLRTEQKGSFANMFTVMCKLFLRQPPVRRKRMLRAVNRNAPRRGRPPHEASV